MNMSTAERVLRVWEQGLAADSFERALLALHELGSSAGEARWCDMTVGECDRELFAVRCGLFGERFAATVPCAGCGARLQVDFELRDVVSQSAAEPRKRIELRTSDDVSVAIRVPRIADVQCAAAALSATDARQIILQRCIEYAASGSRPMQLGELSAAALSEIDAQLERADPDANVVLQTHCPTCNSSAEHLFDIAGFLWAEIEVEAIRLLREVHQLARGYGWRESDILAMTPLRRRAYLEMLPA